MPIHAIITAGGIPKPDEPLYPFTQGKPKALLDVVGKPMAQWILDALNGSSRIGRIVIAGLTAEQGTGLISDKPLDFLPNQGGMINNIQAGLRWVLERDPQASHALLVSSDIPTITSAMADWTVEASLQTDHDVYYSVIRQSVMEARFPGSKRTYTKLKGLTVCGGDMNVIATRTVKGVNPVWDRIIEARKNVVKQAALVGLEPLWLILTHRLSVERAEALVEARLGIRARVLDCPYAEVGMDVDKPRQLELVSRDLERRKVRV